MGKTETLEYTQNRELSWLRFNQRVLEEAQDESVPLMERMKFVAIFTSNLDEFFMIRVGSLYDMAVADSKKQDIRSGMTPKQQLEEIYKAVAPLYKERDKTYAEIKKQLQPYGVCGLDFKELEQQEKKYVKKYFKEQVLPVLSPQIVDANHPFPHLLNKDIYVVATLKMENNVMLGIVPVPQYISDVLYLPGHDVRYIRMEKVIMEYLRDIATSMNIPCLVNLHQVDVALHYSDRIIGMHQGSIVFNGKPQELGSDVIEKIYGVPMNELISKVEEVKA